MSKRKCSKFIKFNQFSNLLIDHLKQQGWKISKKRVTSGYVITGIEFKNNLNTCRSKTEVKELEIITKK
jgi:hypothetical protein